MDAIELFVNGTLMRGGELHDNLAGARFISGCTTGPHYRLYSVGDRHPAMIREADRGVSVAGELYEVPLGVLQRVLECEPDGLGIGVVELDDGGLALGIVWLAAALPSDATDISTFGDWRRYRAGAEVVE